MKKSRWLTLSGFQFELLSRLRHKAMKSASRRPMRFQPLAQRIVHARLPALAGRLERLDDIGVVTHGKLYLRRFKARPAQRFHLRELLVGRDERFRIGLYPALDLGFLRGRVPRKLQFLVHNGQAPCSWLCAS